MAQVFDNHMTAHVWAAQTQESGRSHNGNFFFTGRTLFSYGPHYVVGYALPLLNGGALYLLNADSSSITTNGKHKPAAWGAVPGRACSVPNLTYLRDVIHRHTCGQRDNLTTRRKGLKAVKAALLLDMPGAGEVERILDAMGAKNPGREAWAIYEKARKAAEAEQAKAAQRELDQNARLARYMAERDTPEEKAREVREKLAEAAGAAQWQEERLEHEAAELGRECFRAAKAAKAKGWTRIAKACRELHKAARGELKRYETGKELYARRANVRAAIRAIADAPERFTMAGQESRYARAGEMTADARRSRHEALAGECDSLRSALLTIAASPYAMATQGEGFAQRVAGEAGKARAMGEHYRGLANAARVEMQREAAANWRATGERPPYSVGRLACPMGGALIRARDVQRDDSGAIIGGELETSWAARVPLAHAVRAFGFLKLCHDTGRAWAANGRTIRVGYFRIDSVDDTGGFVAGCHRIAWGEIERLAVELGVFDVAGNESALEPSRGAA